MIIQSVLGFLILLSMSWALSENRGVVRLRTVTAGVALQIILALILLNVPASANIFLGLNWFVLALEKATREGTSFVFGYLGGGNPPFEIRKAEHSFILVFRALPLILIVNALTSLFFTGVFFHRSFRRFPGFFEKR